MSLKENCKNRINELTGNIGIPHMETILMAIEKVAPTRYGIDSAGYFLQIEMYGTKFIYNPDRITYDESKSYDNQTEEFYSFLYNIIK